MEILRKLRRPVIAALAVGFAILSSALAQDASQDTNRSELFNELTNFMEEQQAVGGLDEADLFPDAVVRGLLDADGIAALQQSLTAYYSYRATGLEQRTKVFAWQHTSTIIIFAMVMLIVFAGLYFSWMQFRTVTNPDDMKVSSIELGAAGIKVTSPVLGVIILALSLAFFYLYLVHVYPVTEVF